MDFKLYFIALFALVLFGKCSSDNKSTKEGLDQVTGIYHYNIIVAPDLSNRVDMKIHPKPIKDQQIISTTLEMIGDVLVAGHRETDQKDEYSISFVNQGVINMYNINQSHLNIDFSKFPNQLERMDFIKGRKKYENDNLKTTVDYFVEECDKFYQKASCKTDGADLWSFFQTGISGLHVKKPEKPFLYSNQKFQNRYKNILVLLTDGYIECGLTSNASQGMSRNQSYDLGQSRIKAFRKAFKASGSNNMQEFFIQNGYGIVPAENKHLEDIEVLVLEMYDRSLSESGNATIHPTDAEIMELFWRDWLIKSGVKRFELHQCFSNKREAQQVLRNFILEES